MIADIAKRPLGDMDIRRVLSDLVQIRDVRGSYFVNLPLLYPDGSFVTVCVDRLLNGEVRVSDAGFAFREVEDVGRARSFARVAAMFAEAADVSVSDHSICVVVGEDQLERAICDVASTSWKVAEKICQAAFEEDEGELVDE